MFLGFGVLGGGWRIWVGFDDVDILVSGQVNENS